jgi:hypothetical protein
MSSNLPRPIRHFVVVRTLAAVAATLFATSTLTAADVADGSGQPVNLCVVVAAPVVQPTALDVVRRVVGTDAVDGGLPAGSTLRVYWSKPTGLAEAAGPVRIQDTALETVEADGNAPRIAVLLQSLDGHSPEGQTALVPLLVPTAVDYLARYAPPAAPDDATVVLALGPWTFGDPDPDPALVPTEALLAQATPRESPFGCAQAEPLTGASWFAFGAAPAGTWGPVVLSAYVRHRGAVVRDAIPVAPSAEAIISAVRRAGRIAPLPANLPDRPDGRPGFVRVALTPGAQPTSPILPRAAIDVFDARLPTGAETRNGEPIVITPLPIGVPASGPLVASLVWYEDASQGPQSIAADLDLWLRQDRERLDFQHPRCPDGRLSTDLTSQGRNLQSEVAEYASAGADTVLGVNVYRNDTGKTALATLRVAWLGGVARLTVPLAGTGERLSGGETPASAGNGFRIRLGDLFGLRRENATTPETAALK